MFANVSVGDTGRRGLLWIKRRVIGKGPPPHLRKRGGIHRDRHLCFLIREFTGKMIKEEVCVPLGSSFVIPSTSRVLGFVNEREGGEKVSNHRES